MRYLFKLFLNRLITPLHRVLLFKNVKNSSFDKKVLISYITFPLSKKNKASSHTNLKEFLEIIDIFHDMKYSIDVIDYNINLKLDFNKYDLIFGFGETFESSFNNKSSFKGKRIYYATGAHVFWQNSEELKRIVEFNKRKNTDFTPKRVVPWNWSISTTMSDAIIVIGNAWTASTYKRYCDIPIYLINATGAFQKFKSLPNRHIEDARKSFVWFGSTGLIHKGLDVCLDFFSKHRDYQLHIFGVKENDFFEVYKDELNLDHIHYHGFVNTESELFEQIVSKCLFSIMPSCSEGQCTALLTTMGTGLIPIATEQTGVDVDKYGFVLEDISENAILNILNRIEQLNHTALLSKSEFVFNESQEKHTLVAFKNSFSLLINKIIANE